MSFVRIAATFVMILANVDDSCAEPLETGTDWFVQCESADVAAKFLCFGFVGGVIEADRNASIKQLCLPRDFPLANATDMVLGYLRRNPKRRDLPFATLIVEALKPAYACKI